MSRYLSRWALVFGGSIAALGCGAANDAQSEQLASTDQACLKAPALYTPPPDKGAIKQVADLLMHRNIRDAALVSGMIAAPQAVWFTGDTPANTKKSVHVTMERARNHGTPVLVAYNLPFRDCSQYSAGGAATVADYEAWIDGFAAGIGAGDAIVVLEPDGLGIIPWYNPFADRDNWVPPGTLESCQPAGADPATASTDRFAMLNYAVNALKANAGTKVYLDATHSGWLGAGDAADRLLQAGVKQADGFFLNVSNYQPQPQLEKYATWISKCIWFADPTSGSWGGGHAEWCGSQYSPANPNDFSTWGETDAKYASDVESQTWVPYPGDAGLKHFIIDTSRNGTGPLDASKYAASPYNQSADVVSKLNAGSWCNPPGAGLGLRPKANPKADMPLLDAYLWIKIPGQSDGSCDIAGGARAWDYSAYNPWSAIDQNHFDPLWGITDPAAGAWFPQQALQLAQKANPALF